MGVEAGEGTVVWWSGKEDYPGACTSLASNERASGLDHHFNYVLCLSIPISSRHHMNFALGQGPFQLLDPQPSFSWQKNRNQKTQLTSLVLALSARITIRLTTWYPRFNSYPISNF